MKFETYLILICIVALSMSGCKKTDNLTTGSIEGNIVDIETLLPVKNATISTTPITVSVESDAEGNYKIENLGPNEYEVKVSKEGYLGSTQKTNVTVGMTNAANFKLIERKIPAAGLIAYYPFKGNANDESGNDKNMINSGATLITDRNGLSNNAYYFDQNVFIEAPDSNMFYNLSSSFSISLWCKVNKTDLGFQFPAIINKLTANGTVFTGFYLGINSSETTYRFRVGSNYIESALSLNKWQHLIISFGNSSIKLFIDSKLMNSLSIPDLNQPNKARLTIGKQSQNDLLESSWFNGIIDDVRIYNKALSDIEVIQLYNE